MPVKKKKRLYLEPEGVKFVITKDGKLLAPDKTNTLVCVNDSSRTLPSCETVMEMMAMGETLNAPGGVYFNTTREILDSYRVYNLSAVVKRKIRENIGSRMRSEKIDFSNGPLTLTAYESDDIRDYISLYAASKDVPTQLQRFAEKGENIVLSSAIIDILDAVIDTMKNSDYALAAQYANLIYDRYMAPENAGKSMLWFADHADMASATYARTMNSAISMLSGMLFGKLPDDDSLLLYDTENGEIKVCE